LEGTNAGRAGGGGTLTGLHDEDLAVEDFEDDPLESPPPSEELSPHLPPRAEPPDLAGDGLCAGVKGS
jgi:hypothetical protein